jgi:hypothetical protein
MRKKVAMLDQKEMSWPKPSILVMLAVEKKNRVPRISFVAKKAGMSRWQISSTIPMLPTNCKACTHAYM